MLQLFDNSLHGRVLPGSINLGTLLAFLCLGAWLPAADDIDTTAFERDIRPALIKHCYECHSTASGKAEGGLLLDSQAAMLSGGDSGPTIVAGSPAESLLIEALKYESFDMPPSGKLDAGIIEAFEHWISAGAPDPRTAVPASTPGKKSIDWDEARQFWAFQSPGQVQVPQADDDWSRSPIDRFVFNELHSRELKPAAEADRATWLRRVTFDLIGLPPAPEQVDAFLNDQSADAYERVVDRLLASPHYGERWGRHWLDLARYADSNGADENHNYPVAWRYRDYVVGAYNDDKPYDRFVHEQLAGDLLPAETEAERRELLTATGFLVIGPKMLAEQDKEKLVADIVDEQLDTVGKVFMGLTLGCSRCHDHKFDPITAEDYYALAGVFHSTQTMEHLDHVSQWSERDLPSTQQAQELAEFETMFAGVQQELVQLETSLRESEIARAVGLLRDILSDAPVGSSDDEAALRQELTKLIESARVFEIWRQLAASEDDEFATTASLHWHELGAAAGDPGSASAMAIMANQAAPTSRANLAEVLVNAVRDRWQHLAQAASQDEQVIKKLDPADQELFAPDAAFDVARKPGRYLSESSRNELTTKTKQVEELEKTRPALDKAMAVGEAPVKLVSLHVRGSHLQLAGEPLPRRIPTVFQDDSNLPQPEFPEAGSGRLEFAEWLTHPQHPLTARVMVNRIWQGHFGQGLVPSSSNFGVRGEAPSHPELLDWLAEEFQRNQWSVKHLHREIVLSSTYRMAWIANPEAELVDPENRWLWRQNRQRLEAEAIRDSLLVIAGELDEQLGGELQKVSGKYEDTDTPWSDIDIPRRTLLLSINRAALNDFFSTFDYVDPAASLEKRPATIVPHQTLFLMNHPLALHAGWALANRVTQITESPIDRVRAAYAIAFSRYPTAQELTAAMEFVASRQSAAADGQDADAWISYCRGLLLTNELLYIE